MKNIYTLLLLLLANTTFGQRLDHEYTEYIGGTGGVTVLNLALPDPNGGFTIIGYSKDTSATGIIPPNPTGVGLIFIPYDANGNRSAVHLVPNWGGAGRMVRTPDGNVVCLALDTLRGGDILIYKMNPQNGAIVWRKTYGSSQQDNVWDLIATPDGGFLVAGSSRGSDGDIPSNHRPPGTYPPADYVLLKTDSGGNKEWLKVLGTSGEDDSFVDLYAIGGAYYFITTVVPKDYEFADVNRYPQSRGLRHSCMVKLDTGGNILFSRTLAPGAHYNSLFDPSDSSFVITGAVANNELFPPFIQSILGSADAFFLKTDLDGNILQANTFGFATSDGGNHVTALPGRQGYVIGGQRFGNAGSVSPILTGVETELYLTDYNGKLQDTFQLGGPRQEYLKKVFYNRDKVYAFGTSSSDRFFSPIQTVRPYNTLLETGFVSRFSIRPLGIENLVANNPNEVIRISPNPAQTGSGFSVAFLSPNKDGRLRLLNASGAFMGSWNIPAGTEQWQCPLVALPAGAYVVSWQPAGGTATQQKLILQ